MEIRTVLCPVDFSGQTGRELSLAKQICQKFGARLVVEHNLDPRPPNFLTVTWMWSEEFEGDEEQKAGKAQERLGSLLEELSQEVECEAKLTRGPIDDVLLLLVKELPADMLVMGSHGWSSAEHQSLTEKMISRSQVPVLTVGNAEGELPDLFVRQGTETRPRILVTVDDDRKPQSAVTYAARLAEMIDGQLHLIEVLAPDVAKGSADRAALAEERLAQLLGDTGAAGVQIQALEGRQADFDLLHRSPCPVAYVPAKYEVA